MRTRIWFLATGLAVTGGCGTTEPGCDVCTTSAVVRGVVQDESAQPVVGAVVNVDALASTCDGDTRAFRAEPIGPVLSTDASGSFRTRLRSPLGPFTSCVRVRVIAPPGGALGDAVVEGSQLRFREDYPNRGHDSIEVNVILPVSAPAP